LDLEKFRDDIYSITERLAATQTEKNKSRLNFVRQRLIELYQKNLVKINHSVLEIICASNLIKYGYTVDVERSLCIGCCSCETIAPTVFAVDKTTRMNPKSHVINKDGATSERILDAAQTCPTKAISVEDIKLGRRLYPYK